jgi:hypothetical protein
LPLRLGDWHGKRVPLEDELFEAIGAEVVVDRLYRNSASEMLTCHTALFVDYGLVLPHPPRECYRGSGYELLSERPLAFQSPDGREINAALMELRRHDAPAYVLFWYQLGDHTYARRTDAKTAFRALRGCKQWPALAKVMLQSTAMEVDEAKADLTDLGGRVFDAMNAAAGLEPASSTPRDATATSPRVSQPTPLK